MDSGEITEFMRAWFVSIGYAMPRFLAMLSLMPFFGKESLPALMRTCVALSFAMLVAPTLAPSVGEVARPLSVVMAIFVKEVLIGFTLGFIVAIPLWAFESMGAFLDNQRGASIAETLNPMTGHDSSPLGELFNLAAMVYLFIVGGFSSILRAIYNSYRLWPVFDWFPTLDASTPQFLLGLLDRLTSLAVLLGTPVIFAMFLSELGLALVSRFAPQLQVFFMVMAVKSGIAMFMLSIYVITLADLGTDLMSGIGQRALTDLQSILR